MTEGERGGCAIGECSGQHGGCDFDGRCTGFRNEVSCGKLHGATGSGRGTIAGDNDADEVDGIGCGNGHSSGGGILLARVRSKRLSGFARVAQGFDGLRESELLALEAGNESAAADDAAGLKTAKHAKQLAPAGHGGFALHEIAKDNAVTPEKDEGG